MITRQFTRAALAAIGVPPASPADVEYSDVILEDRQVCVLGYSALRECVFLAPDDGLTYAVHYTGPIDSGDWEFDDSGVPYGLGTDTADATRVDQVLTVTEAWQPVEAQHDNPDELPSPSAVQRIVDLYEEAGADPEDARQWAAEILTQYAEETAADTVCCHLLWEITAEYEEDGKRYRGARCVDCREPMTPMSITPAPAAADERPAFKDAAGRTGYEGDIAGGTTSGRYQATLLGPVVKIGKGKVKIRMTIGASGFRPRIGDEVWISTDRVFLVAPQGAAL